MEKGPSTFAEYWTSEYNEMYHFNEHGEEMGYENDIEGYSNAAKNFANNNERGIKSFKAENGSITKFNPKTGQFIVISKNGKIITYYKATENHFWNKFYENNGKLINY